MIFFFSFAVQILSYIGAMQWVIMKLGWILQSILGTTLCESLSAAANPFIGMVISIYVYYPNYWRFNINMRFIHILKVKFFYYHNSFIQTLLKKCFVFPVGISTFNQTIHKQIDFIRIACYIKLRILHSFR